MMSFRICIAAFVLLIGAIGCASDESEKHPAQKALSKSDYEALRQEFTAPTAGQVQRRNYPVKQGNPPIAVLVPAGNSVRVINSADGRLIATGATDRDTVLSVDPKAGVTLGRDKLAGGPIASAQPVAIYFESINPNPFQPPTTRPAN